MGDFKLFRKASPTNEPGSCLWCGKELRRSPFARYGTSKVGYLEGPTGGIGERGGYGDNAFCGLRCGYQFAVIAAMTGWRIAPIGKNGGE